MKRTGIRTDERHNLPRFTASPSWVPSTPTVTYSTADKQQLVKLRCLDDTSET